MKLHAWIARALWIAGASLGISFVAGLLSLVLQGLGDRTAAEAVHGVTLVSLTVFVLSLVVLVIILAVNELQRGETSKSGQDDH